MDGADLLSGRESTLFVKHKKSHVGRFDQNVHQAWNRSAACFRKRRLKSVVLAVLLSVGIVSPPDLVPLEAVPLPELITLPEQ